VLKSGIFRQLSPLKNWLDIARGEQSMNTHPEPTREEMIEFLSNHFRYNTMNSWNMSTSYSRNIKIDNIDLTREQRTRAYDFIEAEGAYDNIKEIIHTFDALHEYNYQIGFNGCSGGYLVLYQGGKNDPGYKTRCDTCGKLTWYETEQLCKMSGCDGTLTLLKSPVFQIFTQPCKGMDMEKDFADWEDDSLRNRYDLVKEFDAAVDECISVFKAMLDSCKVVEKEIMVPKTIRVIECAGVEA